MTSRGGPGPQLGISDLTSDFTMVFLVLFAILCCQAFNVILSRDFTLWFLNHPPPINLLTYIVHYLTFTRFFALNSPIHSNANFDSPMHKDTENYCLVNGKLSVSCIGFSFLAFPLHSAVKHSGGIQLSAFTPNS